MKALNTRTGLAVRILLAVAGITAFLGLAGKSLAPGLPLATWLLGCAAVFCGLVAVVATCAVLSLQLRQFVLRKGGTDIQWLAFRAESDGLVAMRQALKEAQDAQEARHAR